MPPADVAVIIPAKNEADRIGATVSAARGLAGVDLVIVVDDGSSDDTAAAAASAGARVVGHNRCRGKSAAMYTGVRTLEQIEAASHSAPHHLLFLDADLGASAAGAGPLTGPVRSGEADMTIAVFRNVVRIGGFGVVTKTSGAGIERATGWRPVQPLNGQRCLTRAAFNAALPLAPGWGVETAMTIDLLRQGLRIVEVEVPLAHRATGTDWRAQLHRLRQLRDVTRALAVREPANWRK
jgi:glycosyltransferase involved in cell wall biosynthesis